MPIFRVKSVKIYTGPKKFTRIYSWRSWQISGMVTTSTASVTQITTRQWSDLRLMTRLADQCWQVGHWLHRSLLPWGHHSRGSLPHLKNTYFWCSNGRNCPKKEAASKKITCFCRISSSFLARSTSGEGRAGWGTILNFSGTANPPIYRDREKV